LIGHYGKSHAEVDRQAPQRYLEAMFRRLLQKLQGRGADRGPSGPNSFDEAPGQPGEQIDLATLVPIIMPREAMDGWPGPIVPVGDLPFAVAWATMPRPNVFAYVNDQQAADWEECGESWRALALRNLARMAAEGGWGDKRDASGNPFVIALLTADAIGPSRLLLPHFFDPLLGPGYHAAIPERTCAIVYRAVLSDEERHEVDGMIDGCFAEGTEPVSPARFDASCFWILGDPGGGAEPAPDRGATKPGMTE
jgi:hypothetical protein